MTSITGTTSYNTEYNIPRVYLSSEAKQNKAIDGKITLVPGADCPIEFRHGNSDGLAINLAPFELKMVFWRNARFEVSGAPSGFSKQPQEILLSKAIDVVDPYEGISFVLITHDETSNLYQKSEHGGIRWGVYLINSEKQVFPMIVNSSGTHFAEVVFDYHAMPSYDQIIGA